MRFYIGSPFKNQGFSSHKYEGQNRILDLSGKSSITCTIKTTL